ENPSMAMSLGIPAPAIRTGVVVVSSALAGVTGVMLGYLYSAVTPALGFALTVKAMLIVIVGGLSSVRGAVAVSLILGIGEVLIGAYISTHLRDMLAFGLLLLVLIVRPQGLFGNQAALQRA